MIKRTTIDHPSSADMTDSSMIGGFSGAFRSNNIAARDRSYRIPCAGRSVSRVRFQFLEQTLHA